MAKSVLTHRAISPNDRAPAKLVQRSEYVYSDKSYITRSTDCCTIGRRVEADVKSYIIQSQALFVVSSDISRRSRKNTCLYNSRPQQ